MKDWIKVNINDPENQKFTDNVSNMGIKKGQPEPFARDGKDGSFEYRKEREKSTLEMLKIERDKLSLCGITCTINEARVGDRTGYSLLGNYKTSPFAVWILWVGGANGLRMAVSDSVPVVVTRFKGRDWTKIKPETVIKEK